MCQKGMAYYLCERTLFLAMINMPALKLSLSAVGSLFYFIFSLEVSELELDEVRDIDEISSWEMRQGLRRGKINLFFLFFIGSK